MHAYLHSTIDAWLLAAAAAKNVDADAQHLKFADQSFSHAFIAKSPAQLACLFKAVTCDLSMTPSGKDQIPFFLGVADSKGV